MAMADVKAKESQHQPRMEAASETRKVFAIDVAVAGPTVTGALVIAFCVDGLNLHRSCVHTYLVFTTFKICVFSTSATPETTWRDINRA
jgi:hypothetical protein